MTHRHSAVIKHVPIHAKSICIHFWMYVITASSRQFSLPYTDTPAGKLPLLEIDGKVLNQSLAIGRFLATKAGLVAQDPLDAAYCDAMAETMKELAVAIFDVK